MTTRSASLRAVDPLQRAGLWGQLAANLVSEIVSAGLYEQALPVTADVEAHARFARLLEEDQARTLGLLEHMRMFGPALPETAIAALRDLSRLAGWLMAQRGQRTVTQGVKELSRLGERWYDDLASRFPVASLEAQRYRGYRDRAIEQSDWLEGFEASRAGDGYAGQVEVVEFASIVRAPAADVHALLTDPRTLAGLWGEGIGVLEAPGRLRAGDRLHLGIGQAPLVAPVLVDVAACEAPDLLVLRVSGLPFERWEHQHHLSALGPRTTLVGDRLLVRPQFFPPIPDALQPSPWKLLLSSMLWARHQRLKQTLET